LVNGGLGDVVQFETHFDRYRPQVQQRWKDRRGAGVWQDLGPHLVDQVLQLFGLPESISADFAVQTPGRPAFDYAHVQLRYQRLRVIVHISQSTPAHGLRFAVHGTHGSYIKHGLDVQEDQSKAGLKPGDASWGIDPTVGQLLRAQGESVAAAVAVPNERGNYLGYYAGMRDALLGTGPNPVTPEQALAVMSVLEAGLASARESRAVRM
jgi:predicted dehydrogenase